MTFEVSLFRHTMFNECWCFCQNGLRNLLEHNKVSEVRQLGGETARSTALTEKGNRDGVVCGEDERVGFCSF